MSQFPFPVPLSTYGKCKRKAMRRQTTVLKGEGREERKREQQQIESILLLSSRPPAAAYCTFSILYYAVWGGDGATNI